MKLFVVAAVLLACVASSQAQLKFLENGKEYIYETEAAAAAGTMDYASASSGFSYRMKTRVQVSGSTLNVKFENMKFSQFVGMHDSKAWPFDNTNFENVDEQSKGFSVTLDSNGLFKSMVIPDGDNVFIRNIMRNWASMLQINSAEISKGNVAFRSKEKMLHGDCDVTYTVAGNAVRKSVSHIDDCENRVHRIIDDYRGMRCDGKKGPGYPSSIANTVFVTEKKGSGYQVNAIISTGSHISQFYEEEGSAQYVFTNSTSKLVNIVTSNGDINPSGKTVNDVAYEFSDGGFKWDVDRDLKAREPFFSSGQYFEDDLGTVVDAVKKGIAYQKTIFESSATDKEFVAKAHKFGINSILPAMYTLDYASLKGIADEFFADKSDTGVMKANLYGELLASAGTTASAMVIRDLIMEKKFDNDRDAARALTGVAFHIRRPNKQLVAEFEKIMDADNDRFVAMAAPLALGHLVRITCERAGPMMSPESIRCVKEFGSTYVKKFFAKYQSATTREDKSMALTVLSNLRWGGQSELMKPIIFGDVEEDESLRAQALWAVGWEALLSGKGADYFMPVFADRGLGHELRIAALEMIFYSQPNAAQMANILTVLYADKSYETINYAYALFERYATSISTCDKKTADLSKYFLKYMRQFSNYETDWGFGVSKTYSRQFEKKKYGYGGQMTMYAVGSTESTMPLSVGVGITNTMMDGYLNFLLSAHFRIQGVSKGLIRKFKKIDPATWKTADLEKILSGDMAIRARPDQPVRAQITIMLKGVVVFHRFYDENALKEDGKLGSLMTNLKGMGSTYSINHQRAVQIGGFLYEQPTTLGLPMAVMSGVTIAGHLTATVKRGNHRGLLYRDIEYDLHTFGQANRIACVHHPLRKASFGIVNDRIYSTHFPRKIVVGVNPIKKELKLSLTRPTYDKPLRILMHSQTQVVVRGSTLKGDYPSLKNNCPTCENRVTLTKGPNFVKSRAFLDRENQKVGSYLFGEYFDCEMDISKGNTIRHTIGALMPYNKNPKTAWTSLVMGIRQIRAFFLYFPKNEQCGAMIRWSQSKNNPVNEVEISIRGNVESNGERMFFRGRKWFIKALIKAKGEPAERAYRINVAYEFTPGYLQNKIKVQVNRAPVPALNMDPYSMCLALENSFPDFSKEFLDYDKSEMAVTGKALVQYGKGNSCAETDGEIRVKFRHSTTEAAREELKDKWYYKQCMAMKNTPAWSGRSTLPVAEPCYMTVWDATSARKYTWNIEFVKLTNRMKNIVSGISTAVKAGLLPYWDVDPEAEGTGGDIGPFLNIESTLKNNEKNMDIKVTTRRGEEEYNDVPLRLNWSKRLRNLKFTNTLKRLFDKKILNPCVATSETIRTNDNVTYSYVPSSCWTLTSASCGPTPVYAVFTKKASATPLAARVYIGGHLVEFNPKGQGNIEVSINGSPVSIENQKEATHKEGSTEVLKIFRWGNTYNVYSFLKVWVAYDGNFVEVVPAPSTKGQHCGMCGNFNRNQVDEFTGKNMEQLDSAASMVDNWKWQC